jgi:hypothetical protein
MRRRDSIVPAIISGSSGLILLSPQAMDAWQIRSLNRG